MIAIPGCGRRYLLLAVLALLPGCSRSATVEGTVTLDGAPVEAGHITFVPTEGTAGPGAQATIASGHYTIDLASRAKPGVYRVEIAARRKTGKTIPAGSPFPPGTMVDEEVEYRIGIAARRKTGKTIPAGSPFPPGTMVEEEVEDAPARYNKKSTLRQELKAGPNIADFAVTTEAN
jgi:hypothetical protein